LDALRAGSHRQVIEQDFEMGRPSYISVSIEVGRGQLTNMRIGACAVRVSAGKEHG